MSIKTDAGLDAQKIQNLYTITNIVKFVVMSAIGIFIFFIPVTFNGKSTIPVDHLINWLQSASLISCQIFVLATFVYGAVLPFIDKSWNRNAVTLTFTVLKIAGAIIGFLTFFKVAPALFMKPDMLPFIFNRVALPVGLIVPVGSSLLLFLTGYGLMEFTGVLMTPLMRPIWKVPGIGALNAVTSFVGSFSVGMLMTNKLYKEGRFNKKEAAIILTGFATVSATFMVIVAKNLGIMNMWNLFFWSTLVICFTVSAITPRLWPLTSYKETYYKDMAPYQEKGTNGDNLVVSSLKAGLEQAQNSPNIVKNFAIGFKEGFEMSAKFLPVVMSVGLLGYILAKMTPVFDYLGYILYPFVLLTGVPDAFLVAKVSTVAIVDMSIPSALLAAAGPNIALAAKYIVGVVSISAIMFFDGTIPIVAATDIEMPMSHQVIIFIERAILSILLAGLFVKFIL